MFNEFVNSQEKFIVSTKDGQVDVSLMFGDTFVTAFKGEKEVLIDVNGNGLYNEHFRKLSKHKGQESLFETSRKKIDNN